MEKQYLFVVRVLAALIGAAMLATGIGLAFVCFVILVGVIDTLAGGGPLGRAICLIGFTALVGMIVGGRALYLWARKAKEVKED